MTDRRRTVRFEQGLSMPEAVVSYGVGIRPVNQPAIQSDVCSPRRWFARSLRLQTAALHVAAVWSFVRVSVSQRHSSSGRNAHSRAYCALGRVAQRSGASITSDVGDGEGGSMRGAWGERDPKWQDPADPAAEESNVRSVQCSPAACTLPFGHQSSAEAN